MINFCCLKRFSPRIKVPAQTLCFNNIGRQQFGLYFTFQSRFFGEKLWQRCVPISKKFISLTITEVVMASGTEVILKFSVHKYSSYSSNYYPEYVRTLLTLKVKSEMLKFKN